MPGMPYAVHNNNGKFKICFASARTDFLIRNNLTGTPLHTHNVVRLWHLGLDHTGTERNKIIDL